jgi:L-glyceraldehyde 3-phosphate reductase
MSDSSRIQSYRRCGRSGLLLPPISLGLWQALGSYRSEAQAREVLLAAFARGIVHFDLANNYGSPAGASETLFGKVLKELPRHEVCISSKAGHLMWPGPYGTWCSRKHLIESCEQSLQRLGVDHVDIFYIHRYDPETPLEESLGAVEQLIRQGKALYAGLSNHADPHFTRALGIVERKNWSPITIHQPRYSLLDRRAEKEVLPTAGTNGVGVAVFSPLEQGILAGRYLHGIPADSRVAMGLGNGAMTPERLKEQTAKIEAAQRLAPLAARRGQTLAQLSLAWILKDPRITSVIIGASTVAQLDDNLRCLSNTTFSSEELHDIDRACGI